MKIWSKNKIGTILRINKKNFEDDKLPHELFPTTKQTSQIRNAFANNISIDVKLSKVQNIIMIQSGGFFRNLLCNLGKKVITDLEIPLARNS